MSMYAQINDVKPYIQFISDNPTQELLESVLQKSDSWINARLSSNSLKTWKLGSCIKPVPGLLRDAAVYYAVSDIILALYNGEDMPTQYDTYFNKAELLVNAYIKEQTDLLADTELKEKNVCRWSKTPTYYQQKHRKR